MSVYKVERRVDTVITHMDISTAKKVYALLMRSFDDTTTPGDLTQLAVLLSQYAEVDAHSHFPTTIENNFVRIHNLEKIDY